MVRKLLIPVVVFLACGGFFAAEDGKRLIALTFDDGPRPYVLLGSSRDAHGTCGCEPLLNVLERHRTKAAFFVVGWRVSEPTDRKCFLCGSVRDCRDALAEAVRHGHEIENHTFGHGPFGRMAARYGEDWVLKDIERSSQLIGKLTGRRPLFVRPPNWDIWPAMRAAIEARGYRVMVKSVGGIKEPLATEDVDSEDYSFYKNGAPMTGAHEALREGVLAKIARRERRGVTAHILVFHELPLSVSVLDALIPELQARGYAFVSLQDYMAAIGRGGAR